MTARNQQARAPQPPPEPVHVTVKLVEGADKGVVQVVVQVDNKEPGSSLVRTSPRAFAFQTENQTE